MYLIDTNILIYYLNNDIPKHSLLKIESVFQSHFNISVLSRIEFLGFRYFSSPERKQALKFINEATVFDLNEEIAKEAIELRCKHSIKLIDAIIASTAKVNNQVLITRNTDDFRKTKIELLNPFNN